MFTTRSYLLVLVSLVSCVQDDHPYCAVRYKRLCQGKGKHVACQFFESGPGGSCENYTAILFNSDLKHFILHYVNRRRQRIAAGGERVRGGLRLPKPQIMMMVEWDRELAFLAQRLADQCSFIHDECRATVKYPYAGQTVGEVRWRRSKEPLALGAKRYIRRVLDAWWGERRRVHPKQVVAPFTLTAKGAVWGHFSQLAVWTLQAMGCGAVHHGVARPRLLLVCDFSHTNMLGQKTISPGPMIPCPLHYIRRASSSYPLLCASVRQLTQQDDEENEAYEEGAGLHSTELAEPMSKELNFPSKGLLADEQDQELESQKAAYKSKLSEYDRNSDDNQDSAEWSQRRTTAHLSFEDEPNKENSFIEHTDSIPTTNRKLMGMKTTSLYRSTARPRYKKTRDRPRRPGEDALLNTPDNKYPKRISISASLKMDKDDVDQLFRDTGFKLNRE